VEAGVIIELDDIVFNSNTPDTDGTYWFITEWEGWDSPAVRQNTLEPTSRHGAVIAQGLHGHRPISLSGVVKAPTESAFWSAYNRLLNRTNDLLTTRILRVNEGGTIKEAGVVRSGEVRQRIKGVGAFEFEIPLIAPDPLKYGLEVNPVTIAAGGSVNLNNVGTYSTPNIVVTLTNTGTVSLKNESTGQRLHTGKENLGDDAVINFKARTVYNSEGKNRYDRLAPTSQWWELGPGTTRIRNTGTASVSVVYRSAWI
jgi:phage-related protein